MITPFLAILLCAAQASIAAAAEPPPTPPAPPSQPANATQTIITTTVVKPSAPVVPGQIATADDLLASLETADRDLRSLESSITHLKRESELIGNRTQTWRGRMFFLTEAPAAPDAPPRRLFQLDFTDLIVDGTLRKEHKTFIFDGRWLIEKQHDEKQIFKREIAPPGKNEDPLALGEGRFPIPIGQKKDRIIERFDASLLPPEQDFPSAPPAEGKPAPALPDWVKDSYQLRLVPKRGTSIARDYREIRIWYRKSDLLPRMARTMNSDDSTDDVILSEVVKNGKMPPGLFDTTVPPGWNAEISEFRAAEAANK